MILLPKCFRLLPFSPILLCTLCCRNPKVYLHSRILSASNLCLLPPGKGGRHSNACSSECTAKIESFRLWLPGLGLVFERESEPEMIGSLCPKRKKSHLWECSCRYTEASMKLPKSSMISSYPWLRSILHPPPSPRLSLRCALQASTTKAAYAAQHLSLPNPNHHLGIHF